MSESNPPIPPLRCSFESWMEDALYHPERGYYSAKIREVGRNGDFSTSATLNGALAHSIANWLRAQLELEEYAQCRTILEIGGGTGELMREVRRLLGRVYSWKKRLNWIMVETSPVLQILQRRTLRFWPTRWYLDPAQAVKSCGGKTLIFHHELVDAFPAQIWRWSESLGQWGKLGLKLHKNKVVGEWVEYDEDFVPNGAHSSVFDTKGNTTPTRKDGHRVEVHHSYRQWLRAWAPFWKCGAMLTMDYGDEMPSLYERRMSGTIRAYYRHQRLEKEQIYLRMGEQDLTCDVNFTDLESWGRELGWRGEPLMTQRAFMLAHDPSVLEGSAHDSSIQFVLDEQGAGSAFKVLVQRVG